MKILFPGTLDLLRRPVSRNPTLRAWDAADEYLLQHVEELEGEPERFLVVNDAFGALALALSEAKTVVSWGDSVTSHRAAQANAARNEVAAPQVVPSTEVPEGPFDVILMKVPKTMSLLRDQLYRLRDCVGPETVIVAGAMAKHIHTSTLTLIGRVWGSTTTSRARKKARLIFPVLDPDKEVEAFRPAKYHADILDAELRSLPGVFSAQHLDLGARQMLKAMENASDVMSKPTDVLDLGCGNGVLGLAVRKRLPEACVSFVDASYGAVASAQMNEEALFGTSVSGEDVRARFMVSDHVPKTLDDSVDWVICNPPFHQGQVMGDEIAWQMFQESRKALRPGGQLWVVGNRHLDYKESLRRIFGKVKVLLTDKRFVVLSATCR